MISGDIWLDVMQGLWNEDDCRVSIRVHLLLFLLLLWGKWVMDWKAGWGSTAASGFL